MAKHNNQSGWATVKNFFGFGSKTTTTKTTTFKLSRSESEKLKEAICKAISGASKDILEEALATNIHFAQECNHEFECNHIGDTDSD